LLHQHQVALQDTACCRIFSMSMNTCWICIFLSEFKKLQNGMCYILHLAWCLWIPAFNHFFRRSQREAMWRPSTLGEEYM
jgi:energy-converting hydrogenase Eha subunit G